MHWGGGGGVRGKYFRQEDQGSPESLVPWTLCGESAMGVWVGDDLVLGP